MKNKIFLLVLFTCAFILSCSKKDDPSLLFSRTTMFFKWGDTPQSVSYVQDKVLSVAVTEVTQGWTCVVDEENLTVTVTPPKDPVDEAVRTLLKKGNATITATSVKGAISSYILTFHIVGNSYVDLHDGGKKYANCYVCSDAESVYYLDITKDGMGRELKDVQHMELLWQDKSGIIESLTLTDDGKKASFFIDVERNDDEEEVLYDGKPAVPEGNALIAAEDVYGNVLWSWHIWVLRKEHTPEVMCEQYSNSKTFMKFNLGAMDNHSGEYSNTERILASYGLYYQWGRKDPFPRPYYYNCEGGYDCSLFSGTGSVTYITFDEMDIETGTVQFARENPCTFILNKAIDEDEKSTGDWMYKTDNTLWGNAKSENDPCPYGWKVPSVNDLKCLTLPSDEDTKSLDTARKQYGWWLEDESQQRHFFLAGGFHSYYTGTIVNMNYNTEKYPYTPEPWEGYYWTSDTKDAYGSCMYFDLTTTRSINKFNMGYPLRRANACQVRCVKIN
ncbi:MAG: hypothetical protein KBS95_00550 [Alistipes sp.]|nr:hypothetical protein [Candidatus Alistipes equi]